MAKHSRYTGGGNGKPLQYSCLDHLMNTMKWQKDTILKMSSPPGQKVSSVLLRKSGRAIISSFRKNEAAGPKRK